MKSWSLKASRTLGMAAACSLTALSAQPALAGWNSSQESIEGMNTWIYTPSTNAEPRAMMLVLHGCAQTNTELKEHGNLEDAAEANNAVMVVPYRPSAWSGNASAQCWAFDGGDSSEAIQHSTALINMVNELKSRQDLNIDETSIYITGLSSGGGMSLVTACRAPDLFAGVDAVSGPTPGASQIMSTGVANPGEHVQPGINKCLSLAGSKAAHFEDQVAHVTYGKMDKDGGVGAGGQQGQTPLVSANFSRDNVEVFKEIYNAPYLESSQRVTDFGGAGADQDNYSDGVNIRVTGLAIDEVGHAWPSGDPSRTGGGTWMAPHDIDYPSYILNWFETHNLRKITNRVPVVTLRGNNPDYWPVIEPCPVGQSCAAVYLGWSDPGADAVDEEDGVLPVTASGLVNSEMIGNYQVLYSATDSEGATGEATRDVYIREGTFNPPPVISLNGPDTITINQGESWVNPTSPTAYDEYFDKDLTSQITQNGSVDASTVGTYTITYSVSDNGTQLNNEIGDSASATATLTVIVQQACWKSSISEHLTAGRAETVGGYQCLTVGGGDQLPDLSFTCEYLRDYGGNPEFSITETSSGVYNKVSSCSFSDADGDGVEDSVDQCPNTPPGDVVNEVGCTVSNPDCEEHTAANYYHKTASPSRAYSSGSFFSPNYFAVGSDEPMAGSTWGTTTLHSTDGANWFVGSCPQP